MQKGKRVTKTQQSSLVHPSPTHLHIVINPASGQRYPVLWSLNQALQASGIFWDVSVTHGMGDGARHAAAAVASGADCVAVYGGDGTVMDVAGGMIGTGVPLLILPGGTGNLVASALDLPRELDSAISLVRRKTYRSKLVDLGLVDDRCFMLRASCGVETEVVQDASPEMKQQFGKWAYILAVARALQEVRRADYEIILDGTHRITGSGVACSIANAGTVGLGDLRLSPAIDLEDGKLDLIFLRNADAEGILSLVRLMMGLDGPRKELPQEAWVDASHLVGHWQVSEAEIRTDPVLDFQIDGDVIGTTPRFVRSLPKALRVVY
jgi:diacylglycerol kinase (ATP)